ncbi:MAG: hypothetical protein OIF50_09285 [Flavobacteriaceae bacterium]|nr:hypothetical protein [Flavobacteriaceae bacterium]
MDESNKNILKKSLLVLSEFPKNVFVVANGSDYLKIHKRNMYMLYSIARERDSNFMRSLLSAYPSIQKSEVDYFIANSNGQINRKKNIIHPIIHDILGFFSADGLDFNSVNDRLLEIASLNEKMENIVRDPIYEEVYRKSMALEKKAQQG